MGWKILFHDAFEAEFHALEIEVQDELLAQVGRLQSFGPQLGRPTVDTLNASKHGNMKELRFNSADGVWRVAFAFDPERNAILLIAGDKSGVSERRFYKRLVEKADKRFDTHLTNLKRRKETDGDQP